MKGTNTVKGALNVSARPDCITPAHGIEASEKERDDAMQKTASRLNSLEAATHKAGFEKEALKPAGSSVSAACEGVREHNEEHKQELAGCMPAIAVNEKAAATGKVCPAKSVAELP